MRKRQFVYQPTSTLPLLSSQEFPPLSSGPLSRNPTHPPPTSGSSKSKSSLFHPPRRVMKPLTPGRSVRWGWGVFYLQFFIKGIILASSKHKN